MDTESPFFPNFSFVPFILNEGETLKVDNYQLIREHKTCYAKAAYFNDRTLEIEAK